MGAVISGGIIFAADAAHDPSAGRVPRRGAPRLGTRPALGSLAWRTRENSARHQRDSPRLRGRPQGELTWTWCGIFPLLRSPRTLKARLRNRNCAWSAWRFDGFQNQRRQNLPRLRRAISVRMLPTGGISRPSRNAPIGLVEMLRSAWLKGCSRLFEMPRSASLRHFGQAFVRQCVRRRTWAVQSQKRMARPRLGDFSDVLFARSKQTQSTNSPLLYLPTAASPSRTVCSSLRFVSIQITIAPAAEQAHCTSLGAHFALECGMLSRAPIYSVSLAVEH